MSKTTFNRSWIILPLSQLMIFINDLYNRVLFVIVLKSYSCCHCQGTLQLYDSCVKYMTHVLCNFYSIIKINYCSAFYQLFLPLRLYDLLQSLINPILRQGGLKTTPISFSITVRTDIYYLFFIDVKDFFIVCYACRL